MENETNLYDELTELFSDHGHGWTDVKAVTCRDHHGNPFLIDVQNFVDCAKKHNYDPYEWGSPDIPTATRVYFDDIIFYVHEYDGRTGWVCMEKIPKDGLPTRKIESLEPIDYWDEPQFADDEGYQTTSTKGYTAAN